MKILKPSVKLITCTRNPEKVIETCGRVCYRSESKGSSGAFVKKLIQSGHESVIEHASATFLILCDRGVSHEIVRHRLASYSQESTRYVKYDDMEVILPSNTQKEFKESSALYFCEQAYKHMIEHGLKPQIARAILPTCLATRIMVTANFREWRHIIKLRTSSAAHPQIRPIFKKVHKILMKKAPNVFGDIVYE